MHRTRIIFFNEKLKTMKDNQTEMKNTVTEVKNTLEGIKSRLNDTEELSACWKTE